MLGLYIYLVGNAWRFFPKVKEINYFDFGIAGLWKDYMKVPENQMAFLLDGLCVGGHYELAKILMEEKGIQVDVDVVISAFHGMNSELIDYVMKLLEKSDKVLTALSRELCRCGMIEAMVCSITGHSVPILYGLVAACEFDQLLVVEKLLDKIPKILVEVCKFDQLSLAIILDFLYGTDNYKNWNKYLSISCNFNSLKCIKFMIKSGATFCVRCHTPAEDHHTQ